MKRKKRDKNFCIKEKSKWVAIAFKDDEFQGLNGIEELTDYELLEEHSSKKAKSCLSGQTNEEITVGNSGVLSAKKQSSVNIGSKKAKKQKKCREQHKNKKSKSFEEPFPGNNPKELQDMSAWDGCFVPEPVKRALSELGFPYPTPIQALTLPSAIRDKMDILGAAETGSGKTLAFGIPLIHFILEERALDEKSNEEKLRGHLRSLVITPTRELAIQVRNHLRAAAKFTDVKVEAVVGGMSLQKQERLLKRCPDIVVATPGRLWELIQEENPYLSTLPTIKHLVIDEADRMIEKGHFAELSQILELVNNTESSDRKTYVFSATLTLVHDAPKRVSLKRKRFKMTQDKKVEYLCSMFGIKEKRKVIDLSRKSGTVESVTESRVHCSLEEKDAYLYYSLLMHPGRTLVFCNSIDCVRRLKSLLTVLGYSPNHLHASMHQRQRLKNLDRFALDPKGILLASDVAARGLDIAGIEHVIHYQVPRTAEIYVHRSGRTGRAQREGHTLMLIEPREIPYYKNLCKVLNRDKDIPLLNINSWTLNVVKERISIARKIDQIEHHYRRDTAQNNWLLKAAKEMDMEIDSDDLKTINKNKSRELKVLKKQMKIALQYPLVSARERHLPT